MRTKCTSASGGIGILVRNALKDNVEVLDATSNCVLWCRYRDVNRSLIIGAVYIPPEGSNYFQSDVFDVIQRDLLTWTSAHVNVNVPICLMD